MTPATPAAQAQQQPDAVALYRWMSLTRAAEERLELLHKQTLVSGSVYRSLGQEAGSVGAACALRRKGDGTGDVVAPSLRATGALLVFGGGLLDYYRQHLSRSTGPSGGRESHIHWSAMERGVLGSIFPLGVMLEVMAGVTLAFKLRGEDRVGLVFSGDGAAATGAWHEGMCFAAAQGCPMILVLENNQFAFSTPTESSTRLESFTEKAAGYGIGAESVDGTDVLAVARAVGHAAEQARSGQGPRMVELKYFRRLGHAQHDAQEYVDPERLAEWEAKDPLIRLRKEILAEGLATADELDGITAAAEEECREAAEAALAEPEPKGPEACENVFTDTVQPQPWTR
jgi:pyruvate dehydrogenase E1 component alpha subunit/2-oxoisovalerate dehydrogenase E1 component alpha subunit